MSAQSRNWCFTLNNPGPVDNPQDWDGVQFGVYQLEQGANSTVHMQGYIILEKKATLKAMKRLHPRCHWEVRKGTHQQAKEYCMKEETRYGPAGPVIWGEEPGQGKRSDILKLKRALDEGKTEPEIARDPDLFPAWMRNFKGIERYQRMMSVRSRQWQTFTIALYGPPGTGKTKWAMEHFPDAYWVMKPGQNQTAFFDGYDGQEAVVIDEFYGWYPFDLLCRMCDRYPLMVNTKGGMVNFYPKVIIITSNTAPSEWYKRGLGAMQRRLEGDCGLIQECGHGWDQVVRRCRPRLIALSAEEDLVSKAMHQHCTWERCFVSHPLGLEQVAADVQPVPPPRLPTPPASPPSFVVDQVEDMADDMYISPTFATTGGAYDQYGTYNYIFGRAGPFSS